MVGGVVGGWPGAVVGGVEVGGDGGGGWRTWKAMRSFAQMRTVDVWYARMELDQQFARWSQLVDKSRRRTLGRTLAKARRKDSLQRVLDGSRGDANRLQQRLGQLVASWDSDTAEAAVEGGVETMPAPLDPTPLDEPPHAAAGVTPEWNGIVSTFDATVAISTDGSSISWMTAG